MTQDEIIEMAREAGFERLGHTDNDWVCYPEDIKAFANLVAAKALAQTQEPVAWGVDWGKDGDIPCVSIIKRLPNDVIEVVAVEYAPYSYTTPPQRTWVGLTADEIWDEWLEQSKPERNTHNFVVAFTRAIEAKLKQKNGYAEEKNNGI